MKRHPLDVFSLVAGLLVIATAAVLLAPSPDLTTFGRLLPYALIAAGAAMLFGATGHRRPGSTDKAASASDGDPGSADLADPNSPDDDSDAATAPTSFEPTVELSDEAGRSAKPPAKDDDPYSMRRLGHPSD